MLPKMVPAEASKKEELHRRLRRMQKEKGDPQGQCLGKRFGGTGQIFTDHRSATGVILQLLTLASVPEWQK
jgi:hypothetical protein